MTFSDLTTHGAGRWTWLRKLAAGWSRPGRRRHVATRDLETMNPHLRRDIGLIDGDFASR